jgi:hypothetical protein
LMQSTYDQLPTTFQQHTCWRHKSPPFWQIDQSSDHSTSVISMQQEFTTHAQGQDAIQGNGIRNIAVG